MDANARSLKATLKACEGSHAEQTRIRVHRSISWLARGEAETETEDRDARLIFL